MREHKSEKKTEADQQRPDTRDSGKTRCRWFPGELTAAVILLLVAVAAWKLFPSNGLRWGEVEAQRIQETEPVTMETEPLDTQPTFEEPELIPETSVPEETEPITEPEPQVPADAWKDNVLVANPLNAMVPKRSQIIEVIFHSDLEAVPEGVALTNLGADPADSIVGWVVQEDRYCILHIAAEGGMSGERCAANMFMNCTSLKRVQFNDAFYTENVTSLRNMFYGCTNLEHVDVGSFQTSNVTNMEHTFRYCLKLGVPDVTGWDLSGVTQYANFLDEEVMVNGAHWTSMFE